MELLGENGKASAVRIEKNILHKAQDGSLRPRGTGEKETLPVGLVHRSVGYKGIPLPDLPYDSQTGVIPNQTGRVFDPEKGKDVRGFYAVGWSKRGPRGVIGTNKQDAAETVGKLLEDAAAGALLSPPLADRQAVDALLQARSVEFTTYADWELLDKLEQETGRKLGKVREKFTDIQDMLAALKKNKP